MYLDPFGFDFGLVSAYFWDSKKSTLWWFRPGFSLVSAYDDAGFGLVSAYDDAGFGLVSAYFSTRFL